MSALLFDDLRHLEEVILAFGRVGDNGVGDPAVGHDIGAFLHRHRHRRAG